jgi:hypothetical protein
MQKHLLALATGVGALAFSAVAFAGSGNTVSLQQNGVTPNVANEANVDQSFATYSEVTIVQGNQSSGGKALVTATQGSGYDNQAYFNQGTNTPHASATSYQDGDLNRLSVSQNGGNQSIQVTQTAGAHNQANLVQSTGSTTAVVYQGDGGYHVLNSLQTGGSSSLVASQYGIGNTIGNVQAASANSNSATFIQYGSGNYAFNTQNGGGNNSLSASQTGTNNQIYSTQSGHNGSVIVQQSNSNNLFVSVQSGSNGGSDPAGDRTDVNQYGFSGQVYGYQASNSVGTPNSMTVTQGGSYNVASYTQTGTGNVGNIKQ